MFGISSLFLLQYPIKKIVRDDEETKEYEDHENVVKIYDGGSTNYTEIHQNG